MRLRIGYEDVARLNLPQRAMLEAFIEGVEQSVLAVGEMSMEQAHQVTQVLERVVERAVEQAVDRAVGQEVRPYAEFRAELVAEGKLSSREAR